jgi:hypothetical protein
LVRGRFVLSSPIDPEASFRSSAFFLWTLRAPQVSDMRRRQLLLLRSEDMFEVGGFYFPDGERHFTRFGDLVREYGQLDRDAAYAYVKRWRRALDVGANVGIFFMRFCETIPGGGGV